MRKTKRVLIEFRHREVTLTTTSCTPLVDGSQPDNQSSTTICPTCGSPRLVTVAQTEGDALAGEMLVQRALQQCGHYLRDALASTHPEATG